MLEPLPEPAVVSRLPDQPPSSAEPSASTTPTGGPGRAEKLLRVGEGGFFDVAYSPDVSRSCGGRGPGQGLVIV
jgi:hypothetical protein